MTNTRTKDRLAELLQNTGIVLDGKRDESDRWKDSLLYTAELRKKRKRRTSNDFTEADRQRTATQLHRILEVLEEGERREQWLTLQEMKMILDNMLRQPIHQPASISASLRTLRNRHKMVIRKRLRQGIAGLYEYKLHKEQTDEI